MEAQQHIGNEVIRRTSRTALMVKAALVVLTLLGCGMVTVRVLTDRKPQSQAAHSLVIDHFEHDFGIVPLSSPFRGAPILEHTFAIRNEGFEPVLLSVVRKNCGCLAVDCPVDIPSNQTRQIRLKVDINSREGPLFTGVVIQTSHANWPQILFGARVFILPPASLDPPCVTLTDVVRGSVATGRFSVLEPVGGLEASKNPNSTRECRIESKHIALTVVPDGEAKEIHSDSFLKRRERHFKLSVNTSELPKDDYLNLSELLTLHIKGEHGARSLKVPIEVYFRHHPSLKGTTSVSLSRARNSLPTKPVRVRIERYDGAPFTIDKIKASDPLLEVTAEKEGPAERHWILASLKSLPNGGPQGDATAASLEIHIREELSHGPFKVSVSISP